MLLWFHVATANLYRSSHIVPAGKTGKTIVVSLGRLLVNFWCACAVRVCVCVSVTPLTLIPLVYGYKIRYKSKANVGL